MVNWILFSKITSLAIVDAVNVCALAVLTALLVNILARNSDNPKKVLSAGLSFVFAVFITYLFYAYILVQFFSTITTQIRGASLYLYKGFGVLIMIIGALNLKDFFKYQRGTFGSEMPLSIRPKVNKMVERVKGPWGAFVTGILVTIFLLTCTVWPLIVAAGLLADYGFVSSIPWFLYYNLIFVLPMLFITFIVYLGSTTLSKVEYWKKKNTRILHLIAGLLLFSVGLGTLMGWI